MKHLLGRAPEKTFGSELFATGPVQCSWPRGVAEIGLLTRVLGAFCHFFPKIFREEKQRKTEFTKLSSVRTSEIY